MPGSGGGSGTVSPTPRRGGSGCGANVGSMHIRAKFGQLGQLKGQFNSPHGFCLGTDEEIIVADTNNHRIQVGRHSVRGCWRRGGGTGRETLLVSGARCEEAS